MSFWGLVLEPKKSYTQREVEQPFHISMAALDLQNCDPSEQSVSVVCRKRDSDFILCNLSKKNNILNVPLNLDFELGGEINFHVLGNSTVHLTGYMIEDMESFEESDDSMGEEEEETEETSKEVLLKNTKKLLDAAGKRKPDAGAQNKSKKAKLESSVEEDEDDSDFDMDDSDDDEGLEEEEEEDDDEDDAEDDDDEPTEVTTTPSNKNDLGKKDKSKQQPGKQNNQQAQASPKTEPTAKLSKKEKKKQAAQQNKPVNGVPAQTNGVPKKVLAGGVQVEDLQVGTGAPAKSGKMVSVYYVGRLKQNNKQFDASMSGPGFKFRLGKGEVISGWDVGIAGMKVGGKRRLTIPAKMAYGDKGAGSSIPPNSTLVFEVELKNVK